AAGYSDSWANGVTAGTATTPWGDRDTNSIADMTPSAPITHDTREIDRVWQHNAATVFTFNSISIPDGRTTCSVALTNNQPPGTSTFKECPDVVQLWDVTGDQGVRVSDHNIVAMTLNTPTSTAVASIVCPLTAH